MQENVLTVTDLTLAIKKQLESRFSFVRVQGEIINFKEQSSGHLYFTLKDSQSQISTVLFRGNAAGLARLPKNGDQVIVEGEVNVYAPRGNYQLIIRKLQFAGVGELLLKLHQLKLKLEALGWFDPALKKSLPQHPRTIGVVTSPTGAVIQDILNVLSRRHRGFHLILNPVKVQGEGAAQEIAQAIDQFNRYPLADVLIVCRGGGSLEDLWAFNEEIVAAAIHRSKIPVISAVGHETDFSIADFVADVRAPTPSAAAEIVMAATDQHLRHLEQLNQRLTQSVSHLVQTHKKWLESVRKQPLLTSPYAILGNATQQLDDFRDQLTLASQQLLSSKKLHLQGLERQFQTLNPQNQIAILKHRLQQLTAHLRSIDPKNLLTKGYSILFRENSESVILSTKEVLPGESVRILLHDGNVKAKVYEV